MDLLHAALAGCFGLVVGSFLNVVIWRLPRGESVVRPPSHCPACGRRIAWRDNLPVLSWLLLRARCRHCSARIAARYVLVEVLTGALFVLAWARWPGELPTAVFTALALAALLAVSVIDWEHKIIPDAITKPGILLAVGLAPVALDTLHPGDWLPRLKPALNAWLHAGAGAAVGAAVILGIRFLGTLAFRKEAMGLGDVKLLAFVGALAGPIPALYALILACFAGAVVGGLRWLLALRRPLRFPLVVARGGVETSFDRGWVRTAEVTVEAPEAATPGDRVTLALTLPAADVLAEEDVSLGLEGRVEASVPRGPDRHAWRIAVVGASGEEAAWLDVFARSRRYVPFGPFLALGGAAVLLYGQQVHWLVTDAYPRWARGLFGGA